MATNHLVLQASNAHENNRTIKNGNTKYLEFLYNLTDALKRGEEYGHEFYVAKDITPDLKKRYSSFKDHESFMEFYMRTRKSERNFYEIMVDNKPRYLAFDLDRKLSGNEAELPRPTEILQRFKDVFNTFLQSCELQYTDQWLALDSSTPEKVSMHLVHKGIAFKNGDHLKDFVYCFKCLHGEELKFCGVDWDVTTRKNGLMRMIGSSKYGQDRPLTIADYCPTNEGHTSWWEYFITGNKIKNFCNFDKTKLGIPADLLATGRYKKPKTTVDVSDPVPVQNYTKDNVDIMWRFISQQLKDNFSLKYTPNEKGYLRVIRNCSSPCFFDKSRIHDKRDGWFKKEDNGAIFYGCYCDHNIPSIKTSCLIYNSSHKTDTSPNIQHTTPLTLSKVDLEVHNNTGTLPIAEYLEKLPDCDIVCVRSNMGTGKTKGLLSLVHKYKKIAIITFRISLVTEYMQSQLKDLGFVSYLEIPNGRPINDNRVTIVIDSIHRTHKAYDLVIIDETVYSLDQLTCFTREKAQVSERLTELITGDEETKPKVVVMDALLNDSTVEFFSSFGKKVGVVNNTYKSFSDRTVDIVEATESAHEFITDVIERAESGKNICCPTSSKVVGENLHAALQKKNISSYLISADTTYLPASEWTKYQVIIYTPTICAGVSFTDKYFHSVVCYFTNLGASAMLCNQMMFRVRQTESKTITMYVNNRSVPGEYLGTREEAWDFMNNNISDTIRECSIASQTSKHGLARLKKDRWTDLVADCKVAKCRSERFFIEEQTAYLELHGVTVNRKLVVSDREAAKVTKENNSVFKALREEEAATAISRAPSISFPEYEKLKRKNSATVEEKLACAKYKLSEVYEVDDSNITAEFVKDLGSAKKMASHKNFRFTNTDRTLRGTSDCIYLTEADILRGKQDNSLAHCTHSYKERLKVVLELLMAMGFKTLDLNVPVIIDSNAVTAYINTRLLVFKRTFNLQRATRITTEKSLYKFLASKLECVGLSLKSVNHDKRHEKQLVVLDQDKLVKHGVSIEKIKVHEKYVSTSYISEDEIVDICNMLL
jgi:hypothetical protein